MNNIAGRRKRERMFIFGATCCISISILFLVGLLADVAWKGWRGMISSSIALEVHLDKSTLGNIDNTLDYYTLIRKSLQERFPEATTRKEKKQLNELISFSSALQVMEAVKEEKSFIITQTDKRKTFWLQAASIADLYLKGSLDTDIPESKRRIKDQQIAWLEELRANGQTKLSFNTKFFTNSDSRDPEQAGIYSALVGTAMSILVAFLASFPLAVLAALYLEMFAPRNRWFDFIEININNLAAVPSVIFGVLGLAVFINIFSLPRSSPLVGGLVLAMMTLPTIVITSRAALSAVPPSLLDAALSLGATRMQGVVHHVLPAAVPGILTGTILGMARALGETAPLLAIGMLAFITKAPSSFTDSATMLPAQVFLWASSPERGFVERTAAAIITLMVFLIAMNATAVYLRKRWEIKW